MASRKKVTWKDVYEDFKQRHPTLAKTVLDFEPYGFATILIFFPCGVRMTYDYDSKRAAFIDT